jgi:hypothetical protein
MKTFHLKPDGDEWLLLKEGAEKPVAAFSSKWLALPVAVDLVLERNARLLILRADGTVKEEAKLR